MFRKLCVKLLCCEFYAGMKLAIIELKIVLAKVLYNFEISTTDTNVKLNFNGIPKPAKPINFVFKKRSL